MTRAQLAVALVLAANEFWLRGWDAAAERTAELAQQIREEAAA